MKYGLGSLLLASGSVLSFGVAYADVLIPRRIALEAQTLQPRHYAEIVCR